ncbi:HNH endonuclease [Marinomonas hwangdonensis]|uniref:HNH endonuclease n=1 Tax=Marinomonas hwangdonensis TaxID=1053647 RepID=A0A3M8Q7Y5_9GAMM|nr:HNH endonuclease [Marinomonas hwangdonensis]RNF52187.1 HNH endonuclease [Marinomonas hwangdonensis]
MLEKVTYTDEEDLFIKQKILSDDFSSNSWSDLDISGLKNKIKKHYIKKQKYICPFCRRENRSNHGRSWDIEHIIPRAKVPNFMFEPLNLCVTCIECNGSKSDKIVTNSNAKIHYPIESRFYHIIHPHFDTYEDKILVIKEGFYYIALTEKGEKTIDLYRLNRFYIFSDLDDRDTYDYKIHSLSSALLGTEDISEKAAILRELAFLATKGAQNLNYEIVGE